MSIEEDVKTKVDFLEQRVSELNTKLDAQADSLISGAVTSKVSWAFILAAGAAVVVAFVLGAVIF